MAGFELMEEIKRKVRSTLPSILPSLLEEVCDHLINHIGVEAVADLKYVEANDLPMMKSIQVRKLLDKWKHESDPQTLSPPASTSGAVNLQMEDQASQEILPVIEGGNRAFKLLDPCFRPGCSISAFVGIHEGAQQFTINLQIRSGTKVNIAIHINPRFFQNELVLNSMGDCGWGKEEKHGLMTLKRGKQCTVTAVCEYDGFKLYVDEQYWCIYKHRMPPSSITHVEVYGDITIGTVAHNYGACQLKTQISKKVLPVCKGATFTIQQLDPGLRPGFSVSTLVSINEGADFFIINLKTGQCREDDNIAIHINPRFLENEVVLNSSRDCVWGVEERHGLMTLERGKLCKVIALCENDGFKLYIDEQYWCSFKHRMPPSCITHVMVDGNITIADITYNYN